MTGTRPVALAVLLGTVFAGGLTAQSTNRPPEMGGRVYQLGMPPVWKGNAGATFGWYRAQDSSLLTVYFHAGLLKDLGSPVVGIGAIGVEGYGGYRGSGAGDGGVRAMFSIPAFRVGVGADYNIPDDQVDVLLRLEVATRRGGIFGGGSMLRLDWLPSRAGALGLGVNVPLWGRNNGETRPQRDAVEFEEPPSERISSPAQPALDSAVVTIRTHALRLTRLVTPLIERGGKPLQVYAADLDSLRALLAPDPALPGGLAGEQRAYHEALDQLFSLALGSSGGSSTEGQRMAQAAREVLLDAILLPYDALLGQRKAKEGLGLFAASAQAAFVRWLTHEVPGLSTAHHEAANFAFQSLVDVVDSVRSFQQERWRDTRLVWLPIQLALRESDYDTQGELNQLIEHATGQRFTRGNQIRYVMNENFQLEFAQSVQDTREYHVLWIHDYRGLNAEKKPDALGFAQTAHVYLQALTTRIAEYDSTGRIPQYFIFLDQNYFESNGTRMWFRVLEDPLRHTISLPPGYEKMEQEMAEAQAKLKQAIAGSRLLQAERRQYGDDWLRNRIRVHINITNPSDFSFSSNHLAGILPAPDNVIRDHRKIAFYDITEEDPTRGWAMYTGMGIGEHYVGANWEDRAVMVKGPSALTTKHAARRLLEQQGFTPDEIPLPLRPRPFGPNYPALVDSIANRLSALSPGWTGEALELHNETGYATKQINVEKAILYSLMPPGSLIKVPDSLWQSWLYASLLTGSALRGCKVLIIAPSLASAPSAAGPTMARAHGLMSALLVFQKGLAPELARSQGVLRIGLYAPTVGVGDLAGRIHQVMREWQPWLRRIYPQNPAVSKEMRRIDTTLAEIGDSVKYLVTADSSDRPKLHLKANFFASPAAWNRLITLPEWGPVFREYIKYLARSNDPSAPRGTPPELVRTFFDLIRAAIAAVSQEEAAKAIAYFTIGSTNLDYRSMYLDGEVQITMTSWNTVNGLVDFLVLVGLCEWPESQEALDRLLPPPGGMTKSMSGLLKNVL